MSPITAQILRPDVVPINRAIPYVFRSKIAGRPSAGHRTCRSLLRRRPDRWQV